MKPLNGEKTHALSAHALGKLREIAAKPIPRLSINPGVIDRLCREALIELVDLPSPYPIHRGGKVVHARITEAGLARLKEKP